jgi:hypothetical protein
MRLSASRARVGGGVPLGPDGEGNQPRGEAFAELADRLAARGEVGGAGEGQGQAGDELRLVVARSGLVAFSGRRG